MRKTEFFDKFLAEPTTYSTTKLVSSNRVELVDNTFAIEYRFTALLIKPSEDLQKQSGSFYQIVKYAPVEIDPTLGDPSILEPEFRNTSEIISEECYWIKKPAIQVYSALERLVIDYVNNLPNKPLCFSITKSDVRLNVATGIIYDAAGTDKAIAKEVIFFNQDGKVSHREISA